MAQRVVRLRVTCPCGVASSVVAGSPVTCSCGRAWDTASVPDADVKGVRTSLSRLRRRQAVFALNLVLAVGVLLLLRTSMPTPVIVVVFVLLWLQLCRPWWQARRTPNLAGAPTWTLTPATPATSDPSLPTERTVR